MKTITMNSIIKKFLLSHLFILVTLLIGMHPISFAADSNTTVFVDLDGDGFNDSEPDTDNNGIPDRFQLNYQADNLYTSTTLTNPDFFAGIKETAFSLPSLSHSDKFSLRKFNCRALSKCRSNFESDFSSNLGVSQSSSKVCVGGICF